eukprot:TRINITY_DN304_c0_g1_i1.p1 TRINITY_DN304_c0_g1~~TRINITY_DN304_c0_g1_i1.p1  ORF type:complete len:328 (-),score=116.05 TRINITY_DN304_c0_g1_i1:634-1617(-)
MGGPSASGNAPQLLGGTAIKPKERKGFEAIRYFIHNPETGEFFTRTPKSWALIIIFYVIYYSCLAGLWYGLLTAYFSMLPEGRPKFTLDESLIGANPGLGIRPAQPDKHIDSSMFRLQHNGVAVDLTEDGLENVDWAKRAKDFMDQYDNITGTVDCESGDRAEDTACAFPKEKFGDCGQHPYGFLIGEDESIIHPCLFIKPNRIYEWVPEAFDPSTIENDESIPSHIRDKITADPNKLYVDCQGENPFDREGLLDQFEYFPEDQGIDFHYFPYIHAGQNYHNPAVAVRIKNADLGRLYHIECKLYAKNVNHHRKDREGLVHFEYYLY